jgi:23S rRNA (guanine745-N1)-methyltransferase
VCDNAHSFDVAREGYVNLLVTHQRRQREPGDSAEMLRDRRMFLDAGHYAPLRDALANLTRTGEAVLDAGCGEGYYTREWPGLRDGLTLWAVDIAKPAVRLAAKRATAAAGASYAVASVYDLPVVDASIDLVVSVFAPLPAAEFERVLRRGGRVVTVTPGPNHLAGLKARLFAEPELHPDTGPFDREGATTALTPAGTERITYDLELTDPADVAALVGMTPFGWYVGHGTRAQVVASGPLRTPVDFLVSTYEAPR